MGLTMTHIHNPTGQKSEVGPSAGCSWKLRGPLVSWSSPASSPAAACVPCPLPPPAKPAATASGHQVWVHEGPLGEAGVFMSVVVPILVEKVDSGSWFPV